MLRRVEQAFGDDDRDRLQHAAVERDVFVDETAEDVHHRRRHDRSVRVQVALQDWAGAGEIDGGRVSGNRDRRVNRRAVIEVIDSLVPSIGQSGQGQPHLRRGGDLNVPHVGLDDIERLLLDQFRQQSHADIVGGDLSSNVREVVVDRAWDADRTARAVAVLPRVRRRHRPA